MPTPPGNSRKTSKRPTASRIETTIDHLNDEGVGIGHFEGKEVWVTGGLTGEKVEVTTEHEGQRRIIGNLQKIITRHPKRIHSPCVHAKHCQGCSLVQLDYSAQLRFKEEKVQRAFDHYEVLKEIKIEALQPAENPFGYRTNAKLVFGKERGRVRIGLYRRGTHDVIDISDCPLHHPLLNKVIQVVRDEVQRQRIFVYDPDTGRGLLRYLTIKAAPKTNKVMVTFVTAEKNFRELTHLGKWLQRKVPEVISVHQNINSSTGNIIFGRETLRMFGVPDLITQIGDIRLRISPTSFLQVNDEQAARIYERVRQWANLNREEKALDLYCGIGGIALNLARDAAKVVGIEASEEAVRNARGNARMNNLRNCDFRAGDAAELAQALISEMPPGGVITLNPPRSGCERKVLETASALAPRTMIYVSCSPETLARDLDILTRLGYRTQAIQPVDMFPQTPHVESIARLVPVSTASRGKRKS